MVKEGAFPLLKQLYIAGDPLAEKVFEKEIETRLRTGYPQTIMFLFENDYVDYLDEQTVESLKESDIEIKKAHLVTQFLELFNSITFIEVLKLEETEIALEDIHIEFARQMNIEPFLIEGVDTCSPVVLSIISAIW